MNGFSKISLTDFPVTCTADYRFSFNGREKVDEIKGLGNHNTALFWEYDTRLGRRWNIDPVVKPFESGYATFSDNPIFNIDPNGDNAGDFYSKDGKHLGSDGIVDDKVYTADQVTKDAKGTVTGAENSSELSVKHSELLKMGAVTYGESSGGNMKETFAIASAIQNNRNGKTIEKTLSGSYSYAIGDDLYNSFMNTDVGSRTGEMQTSIAGAINAVTGGVDYSNGATHWDGIDVLTGGSSHYRQRKAAFDNRKGIYDPGNYRGTFYSNAQDYACKTYGVNGKVYRSIKTLITKETQKGTLWNVSNTHGGSIFYKERKK